MCKGFVKIPRRLFETRWWNKRRVFSETDAIVDLYQMANVRDRTEPNGMKLKRSQFVTSLRALAERWLWPTMNTSNFIKRLKKEGWIDAESSKNGTVITILDFGVDDVPSGTQPCTQSGTPSGTPKRQSTKAFSEAIGTPSGTPTCTQGGTPTRAYNEEDKKEDIPPISPKGERKKPSKFVKPTVDDIQAYITEKGYALNAQQIFDHYEMVGWVYGKGHNPIKDWKAAVRTWNNNGGKKTPLTIGFKLTDNQTDKYENDIQGW